MFFAYLKKLFTFNHQLSLFNRGLVAAMVVVVIFGATSIFAYASGSVVPGNVIYPLKKAVEKLEQKIAPSKSAKIAVYEKQSVRRLEEAVNLSQKNSTTTPVSENTKAHLSNNIEKNISEVVSNHQAVLESINKLDDYQKASAAASQAKSTDKAKTEYLDKIAAYAESNNDDQMLEAVNNAQEVISNQKYKYQDQELEDGQELDNQHKDQNDNQKENNNSSERDSSDRQEHSSK